MIVLEHMSNGSLKSYLKVIKQRFMALCTLHAMLNIRCNIFVVSFALKKMATTNTMADGLGCFIRIFMAMSVELFLFLVDHIEQQRQVESTTINWNGERCVRWYDLSIRY